MRKSKKTVVEAMSETKLEGATVIVAIRGHDYTLCWDMEAVMRAEDMFAAQGHDLNLMDAAVTFTTSNLRMLFIAMLQRYHPDLSWNDRCKLWTASTYQLLGRSTASLYIEAVKLDMQEGEPNPIGASVAP